MEKSSDPTLFFAESVSTVLTNLLERQNHCLVLTKVQEEVLKEILQKSDVHTGKKS